MAAAFAAGCDDAPAEEARDPCPEFGTRGVVELRTGSVRGARADRTCAFLGIPYALPPVGYSRFRAPAPPPAWSGTRDMLAFGPACPQLDATGTRIGSEDCLYLNVWAPPPGEQLRPVVVFFHGGGNVSGSSADPGYDARELAAHAGLVVVSFDYRLGSLGWLAHAALGAESPSGTSGNYGLADQLMALSWVRDHATAFGGDPEHVFVIGQSAGARNACALLAAPQAAGLFAALALHSGACNLRSLAEQEAFGATLVANSACATAPDAAACLRSLDVDEILGALPGIPGPLSTSEHNPCVDGELVRDAPLNALASGEASPAALIVSTNADEAGQLAPALENETQYRAIVEAHFGAELAPALLERYPASAFASPQRALSALITDARYVCPARQTARAAVAGGSPAVYRTVFSQGLEHGPDAEAGAFHGLELHFLFRSFEQIGHAPTARELAASDAMAGYYARFAATFDPNGAAAETWPPYDPASDAYLRLSATPESAIGLGAHCDFWDSVERAPSSD